MLGTIFQQYTISRREEHGRATRDKAERANTAVHQVTEQSGVGVIGSVNKRAISAARPPPLPPPPALARPSSHKVGQGHDVTTDPSDQRLHVESSLSHGSVSGGRWTLTKGASCQQIFGSVGHLRIASATLGTTK
ncbi:hypothetical protein J6590_028380 [Homalodisca vitripennis]|nr:hypothetical protein J6590_028380 [Homalodisca vitripennis]